MACKKEVELKDGQYKGLRMESVEYESAWALGANSGHHDINSVVKMIDQCNDYGMDTIELGNAFSTYMEISEKNGLNGYPPLAWGDYDKMVELTTMIAYRPVSYTHLDVYKRQGHCWMSVYEQGG